MKKILLLLLLSSSLFGQIKIKDLPTTTTGSVGDFLLKDDAAGVPGSTKKISITNFLATYIPNDIIGSGTINYIPKFTATKTIGNSLIFDNGTSVAIGNATPTASTAFEIKSTTGSLLVPRMTTAQITALTKIAGMVQYNSTKNLFSIYTG